jgi:cell division protein ZapD
MSLNNFIIYEQPISELIRHCLRLENLFAQLKVFFGKERWQSRFALTTLIELSSLLERSDLKNSLIKELTRHQTILNRLYEKSNIDHKKLNVILAKIEETLTKLNQVAGKFAHVIRENEFINSIRAHRNNPGGVCDFDVPAFQFWLQQPAEIRMSQLQEWQNELKIIEQATDLVLKLVRDSHFPEDKLAPEGLYQMMLDPKVPCQLTRIFLPEDVNVFPEISVGRHRIYIRFLKHTITGKPIPTSADIQFKLVCCMI